MLLAEKFFVAARMVQNAVRSNFLHQKGEVSITQA